MKDTIKDFLEEFWVPILLIIAFIVFGALIAVGTSHMESKTYNRLTGAHTTWWDAMWVELRVQDQPR